MKIVYLITSLGNSAGMERVLCTKTNYLADKAEYDVSIITEYPLPTDRFFDFSSSITIESLNLSKPLLNSWMRFINSFSRKKEYKKKISVRLKQIKPDITISMYGNEFSFLYKLNDGSIKIAEFHFSKNYLYHLIKNIPNLSYRRLRLLIVKWAQYKQQNYAKHYQKVILLTAEDKKLWGNKQNMITIPNPIFFSTSDKSILSNKQIIAIGRLIAQKGFDLLIESFSMIASKSSDWNLLIVGEGQDKDYLQNLIDNKKLSDRITIKTPVKNIIELLYNSSIFALSSRYEGSPLVLTEAMEIGVPCVAFNCECGPSEIIRHGEDGFLVENGNITQFAKYLEIFMKDDKLRIQMGAKAKINVKRFYTESIMKQWINLFNELEK